MTEILASWQTGLEQEYFGAGAGDAFLMKGYCLER